MPKARTQGDTTSSQQQPQEFFHESHSENITAVSRFCDISELTSRSGSSNKFKVSMKLATDPRAWNKIFDEASKIAVSNSLVLSIISCLTNFCVAGINVYSPVAYKRALYKRWWEKIGGYEVSEQIARKLYTVGNVGVRKLHGTIQLNTEDRLKQILAKYNAEIQIPKDLYDPKIIPYKYVLIDPQNIVVPSPMIQSFLPQPVYYLKGMSLNGKGDLLNTRRPLDEAKLIDKLPSDIKKALNGSDVELDSDKFTMLFFKKSDTNDFAYPILYSCFSDVALYNRMLMADAAITDVAAKTVNFILVGDAKTGHIPSEVYIERLGADVKKVSDGDGAGFIVSQPMLDIKSADNGKLSTFLGKPKYEMVLQSIRAAFSVPGTLNGETDGSANSNYTAVKVLIKNLEYVRNVLTRFWLGELSHVQKAFGFNEPINITFANQELGDETSIKKLCMDLFDRDVISEETLRETMGYTQDVEEGRLKAERKRRGKKVPEKSGPYHNGNNFEFEIKKMALQGGTYTPEELGVPLADTEEYRNLRDNRVKYAQDLYYEAERAKVAAPPVDSGNPAPQQIKVDQKPKGLPGQGRPKNTPDQTKRKERTYSPRKK